ncbi:MAG: Rpn family recombination-promoting nuclease/putative transposase [Treponema sp.]|nr:Rpn family recombination-promoting nuclease/putative transposase [Treponema sp.]
MRKSSREKKKTRRGKKKATRRNYRDTLFVSIFGRSKRAKEYFLSLYNAIHDTDLKLADTEIKPVTLKNVVYKGLENDVSMEINGSIVVLAEQQSTVNYNMPFRCLEYIVAHYNKFFDKNDKYHEKMVKFPRPECYVFYNGDAQFPVEKVMRLSDAFKDIKTDGRIPESLQLDLTVKVFNINKAANHPILQKCEALLGYSNFTEYVRIGKKSGEENPIAYALSESRRKGILTDYFAHLSKEEQSMIFGEWDWDAYLKVHAEEAAEDRAIENAKNFLKLGVESNIIAQGCSLPLEEVLALKEEIETELAAGKKTAGSCSTCR